MTGESWVYRPASLLGRANIPYLYTVPAPWPVVSAAPTDGPRPSGHVFADGAQVAAGRRRLLGKLPGVPHVGHPRAPVLQRAVGGLRKRAYRACVSSVRASRRVVLGM